MADGQGESSIPSTVKGREERDPPRRPTTRVSSAGGAAGGEPHSVSVSSSSGERSTPPALPLPALNLYVGGGPVPPPGNWDLTLVELWVKFPGHPGPVFR